ncbi:MAG: hypothetical protein ACLUKN_00660 [Bacilli bacterium]
MEGMGHMFGPQMYGHEDLSSGIGFQSASSIAILSQLFDDRFLWKDTGGPLWDQLRSYYNMRAADNEEGMTQVVQTDDRIGLKPVVKRFQVFFVPCFTRYDSISMGCAKYSSDDGSLESLRRKDRRQRKNLLRNPRL